jgi:hypothetical protein
VLWPNYIIFGEPDTIEENGKEYYASARNAMLWGIHKTVDEERLKKANPAILYAKLTKKCRNDRIYKARKATAMQANQNSPDDATPYLPFRLAQYGACSLEFSRPISRFESNSMLHSFLCSR